MDINLDILFETLFDRDHTAAYKALQQLQTISEETAAVYPYMDRLIELLDNNNSYLRTRALTLIAYNAKWDDDCKIDACIGRYLLHITDDRPITARQCIKLLPIITRDKPKLHDVILSELQKADISIYTDRMMPLIYQDIQNTLTEIQSQA